MTLGSRGRWPAALGALLLVVAAAVSGAEQHVPVVWTKFVQVAGQPEPIPEQWLDTEEARVAHNLKLPDEVAKTVPFDFEKAKWRAWLPGVPDVGRQYFQHLCDTEAGEWLLKIAPGQRGIYNARPMRRYSTEEAQARYDWEAPLVQRLKHGIDDTILSGTNFVNSPALNYEYVEEPKRPVSWQAGISAPYIKMYGYRVQSLDSDPPSRPMSVVGILSPMSDTAFTWRGTKRKLDREHSISGVEEIVYNRTSNDIYGVRRQFILGTPYKNRPDSNAWLQGEVCDRLRTNSFGGEELARIPLLTAPPTNESVRYRVRVLNEPAPIKKK